MIYDSTIDGVTNRTGSRSITPGVGQNEDAPQLHQFDLRGRKDFAISDLSASRCWPSASTSSTPRIRPVTAATSRFLDLWHASKYAGDPLQGEQRPFNARLTSICLSFVVRARSRGAFLSRVLGWKNPLPGRGGWGRRSESGQDLLSPLTPSPGGRGRKLASPASPPFSRAT
jgi:hypothetical protein